MNGYKIIILSILYFVLIWPINKSIATDYYLATYDEASEGGGYNISVKKISLENASIADSVVLRRSGYLWNKKPVIIDGPRQRFILIGAEVGAYAKNTGPGPETTFVFVLNDSLNIIRTFQIPNSQVGHFEQVPGENGFRFELQSASDTTEIFRRGIYNLDREFRFTRISDFIDDLGPGDIRELAGFVYLNKLYNNSHHLFYSVAEYGLFYLLKLNKNNTTVVSSLLTSREYTSSIFAYHPGQDKIYLFRLNYEQHGKFPEYEKDYGEHWIEPYVLILNPINFDLVDSLPVANFAPDNYPLGEDGQADIVGDYIVYYFFNDEWIGRFNPAMLFIFDTRTNEATWLRVGWR